MNDETTQATHERIDPPAYDMIRDDLRIAWKYTIRALNAARNSGCDNLATYYKIVADISAELEFCESMCEAIAEAEGRSGSRGE